jgi:hypothetical protein
METFYFRHKFKWRCSHNKRKQGCQGQSVFLGLDLTEFNTFHIENSSFFIQLLVVLFICIINEC